MSEAIDTTAMAAQLRAEAGRLGQRAGELLNAAALLDGRTGEIEVRCVAPEAPEAPTKTAPVKPKAERMRKRNLAKAAAKTAGSPANTPATLHYAGPVTTRRPGNSMREKLANNPF